MFPLPAGVTGKQFLSTILGDVVGNVMSCQTVRTDYILFSTYEVQLGKSDFKPLGSSETLSSWKNQI